MDYKTLFQTWFEFEFKQSKLYKAMLNTVEGSVWHREDNVGVHTDMVVDQYIQLSPDVWTRTDFLGAIMCAIHDIGKPKAESPKYSEAVDGEEPVHIGNSYKGHEQLSGMFWIDYALSTSSSIVDVLSDAEVYNIGVMAQAHLPYVLGNEHTKNLVTHLTKFGLVDTYVRAVIADTRGRISDNYDANLEGATEWLSTVFGQDAVDAALSKKSAQDVSSDFDSCASALDNKHSVVVLVGAPASGKSTFASTHKNVTSLDALRLARYKDHLDGMDDATAYDKAWRLAEDDSTFGQYAMTDFYNRRKKGQVMVDNLNVSRRRRRRFINGTKGTTSMIVLLLSIKTNIDRAAARKSKTIPIGSVVTAFKEIGLPLYGETDSIHIKLGFDYDR